VLAKSAVKIAAGELDLPIIQPSRASVEALDPIREIGPDVIVVAAYGEILSRELLALAQAGGINIHPSLLPRLRGATPVPTAPPGQPTPTSVPTPTPTPTPFCNPISGCSGVYPGFYYSFTPVNPPACNNPRYPNTADQPVPPPPVPVYSFGDYTCNLSQCGGNCTNTVSDCSDSHPGYRYSFIPANYPACSMGTYACGGSSYPNWAGDDPICDFANRDRRDDYTRDLACGATACGFATPTPTPAPRPTLIPIPTPTPTPAQEPCSVATSPSRCDLLVGGTCAVTADVISGLGSAWVNRMRFGSYNTGVAAVNPDSDATWPYMTTATGIAPGLTAVWGTADLSDGRVCQSSGITDTDVNVMVAATPTPTPTPTPAPVPCSGATPNTR
jgi:hypothetical protein